VKGGFGMTLYDHDLNVIQDWDSRDPTPTVFPHFNNKSGGPRFPAMTDNSLFAYRDYSDSSDHQYYVCRLDPEEILCDVDSDTYPEFPGTTVYAGLCYYSDVEHVLYVARPGGTSLHCWLTQVDLDGGQVTQFDLGYMPSGPSAVASVGGLMRRGNRILWYGNSGVGISVQEVPEPATWVMILVGGLLAAFAVLRHRNR